ncbi:MAG: GIY-YIG nuclease family protein [Patescibacteria group bacterium]
MKIFFVYILRSEKDGNYYTGLTTNLDRRIKEHNKQKSSTISTKARNNFKLVYYEIHKNRNEARKRELFWKSGYGREIRDQVFST